MKTQLLVNDMVIPLNAFTQQYIGNIARGITAALGCGGKHIRIHMDTAGMDIHADDADVEINQALERSLVECTVKGMLSPLTRIGWIERVTIISRE